MEEEGLSLKDVWSIIMRKKLLVSLSWGITTILCFIFIIFFYNKMSVSYEESFNYRWYGIEDNSYADGNVFNYYDIVALNNLNIVKSEKENYKNIDTEKLAENIDIRKEENNYVLTIKGNFFSNDKQAKEFIYDLIYLPYLKATTLSFDFNSNLESYQSVNKIDGKLMYLDRQMNLMIQGYNGMISYFGNAQFDNKSLNSSLNDLEVYSSNKPISEYRYLAFKNTYMSKEEYEASKTEYMALEMEKTMLKQRKSNVMESLRKIYESAGGTAYIDTALSSYVNTLHTIDMRLLEIEENLEHIQKASLGEYSEIESQLFLKELGNIYEKLREFTDIYTNNVKEVLKENTFINVNYFKITGKINILISIVLSLIAGLILSMIIGLIVGYRKKEAKFKNI